MSDNRTYPGAFEINEKRLATEVFSWASCHELHVYDPKSKFSLDFYLFNPSLLRRLDNNTMSEGVRYAISGPNCATVSRGPLGHPGDGEYDRWIVKNIELFFCYTQGHLNVQLEGKSFRESVGFSNEEPDPEQLRFKVSFIVTSERLKDYLGLSDSAWGYFTKKLNDAQTSNA